MSHNLTRLLQDADPMRLEPPLADDRREQILQKVLRNTAAVRTANSAPPRRTVAAALAFAIITIVALGYGMWTHGTTSALAAVRFEARLAEEQPVSGLLVAQLQGSDRVIYLHPEIVVGNDDIAQSWVSADGPDRVQVTVQLLPSGAERMRQATAMHIGRPMAILIDGGVVMAPVVRSPISDAVVITGDFTRAVAERIADGMKPR
jgi:hypothetical protein